MGGTIRAAMCSGVAGLAWLAVLSGACGSGGGGAASPDAWPADMRAGDSPADGSASPTSDVFVCRAEPHSPDSCFFRGMSEDPPDVVLPPLEPGCEPHAHQSCHDQAVVWTNSCGTPHEVVEVCTDCQYCAEARCRDGVRPGRWAGTSDSGEPVEFVVCGTEIQLVAFRMTAAPDECTARAGDSCQDGVAHNGGMGTLRPDATFTAAFSDTDRVEGTFLSPTTAIGRTHFISSTDSCVCDATHHWWASYVAPAAP